MKKIFVMVLILIGLIVSGCDLSQFSEDVNKIIVCEGKYIRHETGCCLDENEDSICDNDEIVAGKTIDGDIGFLVPGSTCEDTDGDDRYKRSQLIYTTPGGKVTIRTDECVGNDKVLEFVCNGDEYNTYYKLCSSGCKDGACLKGDNICGEDICSSYECGEVGDECEDIVHCGDCDSEMKCVDSVCVDDFECTDSDGGKNKYKRGTTLGGSVKDTLTRRVTDSCQDGSYLYERGGLINIDSDSDYVEEYLCVENEVLATTYLKCENGCKNGACLKGDNICGEDICSDYECGTVTDECDNYVNCGGCDSDETCRFNECVLSEYCQEEDDGKDYYDQGQLTYYTSSGRKDTLEDSCKSDGRLEEYYCIGDYSYGAQILTCPNNGKCANGACVEEIVDICDPIECASNQCGTIDNECDGTINCGNCDNGYYCDGGSCVEEIVEDRDSINCGESLSCLADASETCHPADGTQTTTINLFGIETTGTNDIEIRGWQSGNCIYYQKTVNLVVRYSDELTQELLDQGMTMEEIELAEQQAQESQNEAIGYERTCEFEQPDLTNMLNNWLRGSSSSSDWNNAECVDNW